MPKATVPFGDLAPIEECWIDIPIPGQPAGTGKIVMNNLPDLGDSKQAVYNNIPVMGRSFPFYTYSHSGDRVISLQLHFYTLKRGDSERNLKYLRYIESAVYPRKGNDFVPYVPPVVCKLKCGNLLSNDSGNNLTDSSGSPLCVILQNYNVKFPTDVAWDKTTLCPYRFDVDTSWYVVYTSEDLPYASRIVTLGR